MLLASVSVVCHREGAVAKKYLSRYSHANLSFSTWVRGRLRPLDSPGVPAM